MSPMMSPKNIGKNTATNGVGSMLPYAGSGTMRVIISNGRKSRGFCSTTGADSPRHSSRATDSTTTRSPKRAAIAWTRRGYPASGIHPSSTKLRGVAAAFSLAASPSSRSCAAARAPARLGPTACDSAVRSRSSAASSASSASSRVDSVGPSCPSVFPPLPSGNGSSWTPACASSRSTRVASIGGTRSTAANSPVESGAVSSTNCSPIALASASRSRGTIPAS